MHIFPRSQCQRFVALTAGCASFGWLLSVGAHAVSAQGAASAPPAAAPSPPAWQRELAAVQVLQTAAALASAQDPATAKARQDRVAQLYRDLAAKYPRQSAVQRAAGNDLNAIGNAGEAVTYWQRAETLDPQDAAAAEALGSAALAQGDVRAARDQFQRAVDAQPGEALYHSELANVLYLFRHQLAEPPGQAGADAAMVRSLDQFRLAASLAPQDAQLAQAYAETFYMLSKPDWPGALAAWEKVRRLDAPNTDFANGHLARISLRLGHADEADKYLDAIHDPGFATLKMQLHSQADKLRQQPPAPR